MRLPSQASGAHPYAPDSHCAYGDRACAFVGGLLMRVQPSSYLGRSPSRAPGTPTYPRQGVELKEALYPARKNLILRYRS